MDIEEILEKELDCKIKPFRSQLGHFRSFETDKYGWVFVKFEGDRNIVSIFFFFLRKDFCRNEMLLIVVIL